MVSEYLSASILNNRKCAHETAPSLVVLEGDTTRSDIATEIDPSANDQNLVASGTDDLNGKYCYGNSSFRDR